jgi:predicted AlkP superfamily pyrophosphatase or phosphodiesterase
MPIPPFVRCLFVLVILCSGGAAAAAERPRLIVVISVDQLPFEYLMRMRAGFAEDGFFRAVWDRGAVFSACHHGHAFTITGPGHSVLLTGAYPNTTGIVDNDWLDRTTGKVVYCVDDETVETAGAPGKKSMSPRRLLVNTLGDQMKLASNRRAKVFGVALKDRAAILMAGHMADACLWYDNNSGHWITSTYYRESLPDYARAYNEAGRAKRFGGRKWELLLAPERYELYYPDNAPWESNVATLGRSFPHPIPKADAAGYAKLMPTSPFGTEMTLDIARLVTSEEKLGADDEPDLLCINLSSNDYVGHAYGPYSLEVQDMTFSTDRQLGDFTRFLDETVGRGRWTLALSSDHGVGPIPEHAVQLKLPARRVTTEHFASLREKLEGALQVRFGKLESPAAKYVQHFDSNTVYLDERLAELAGDNFAAAQRLVRDQLLEDDAIAEAHTRDDLLAGGNDTEVFRRLVLSFHPRRSGDVLYVLKPYHLAGEITASHGTPWEYDTHVPLLMLGCGIAAGIHDRPTTPPQMAPTLARLLGVDAPSGTTVEPLDEALK